MIKVGLLGCGGMGLKHAKCYLELANEVKVVAVADSYLENAKKVGKLLGAKVYESADELLETEKVDAIDICLPTFLHAKYGIMAMEKGFDVAIEKPVCLNSEECEALLDAQKRTGAIVQVSHVIRFWNEYVWLKKAVEEKTYGKLKSASFRRLSPNPNWGKDDWFNNYKLSGSMAIDLHIHDVDFVRYIMGEPKEINAYGSRNDEGVIQSIIAAYNYDDAFITVEAQWDYPSSFPFCMDFRVKFENAAVVYEKNVLTVHLNDGTSFTPEFEKDDEDANSGINVSNQNAYLNEIKYFIECVKQNKNSEIAPLSEGVKSLKLVEKEIELAGGVKI